MARSADRINNLGAEKSNMANAPSAEACSALIEYWAKEHECLFGPLKTADIMTDIDQIPPVEMKECVDNYNKWFGVSQESDATREKLAVLKRMEDWWKRNANTLNRLIKYMESTLAVVVVMLIAGCQSGMYQIDTGGGADGKSSNLTYRIVDQLNPDSYSEEYLPVEVSVEKSSGADSSGGLCFLTLGIIPAFYDDFETLNVTIKTPIGTKSGSGSIHAKKWIGWICLIPYPGTADERCDNPQLPNMLLENKLKDEIVRSLVEQFDLTEYARYVQGVKEKRLAEERRVKAKSAEIEQLIKEGKYEDAIASCKQEEHSSKTPLIWRGLRESAGRSVEEHIMTLGTNRLVSIFKIVDEKTAREKILVRLNELCAVDALSQKDMEDVFAQASDDKVRISAINGIRSIETLLDIVHGLHSDAVIIAALKQIPTSSEIRQKIWTPNIGKQLASCYLSAFDSQEELAAVVSECPEAMTDDVLEIIKQKAKAKEVIEAINSISVYRQAREVLSRVCIRSAYGDGSEKIEKDIKAIKGAADALSKLPSCAGRSRAVVEMIKRFNCRMPNGLRAYSDCWGWGQGCFSYAKPLFAMLSQNDLCELIFHICSLDAERPGKFSDWGSSDDEILLNSWLGLIRDDIILEELLAKAPWQRLNKGRRMRDLNCTLLKCVQSDDLAWRLFSNANAFVKLRDNEGVAYGLVAKKLSKEHLESLCEQARRNASKKLAVEGFYPGMQKRDYIVLCALYDISPNLNDEYGRNKDSMPKITFNRKDRYRLFKTEDDEFWRAFLRKYIPQKKSGGWGTKSRTNWDEDETIHEYTSIEYELKISYNSKTGTLNIETWKP